MGKFQRKRSNETLGQMLTRFIEDDKRFGLQTEWCRSKREVSYSPEVLTRIKAKQNDREQQLKKVTKNLPTLLHHAVRYGERTVRLLEIDFEDLGGTIRFSENRVNANFRCDACSRYRMFLIEQGLHWGIEREVVPGDQTEENDKFYFVVLIIYPQSS